MGHLIQGQATPPGLGAPVHSANPRPSGECPLELARTSPGGLWASLGTREGTSTWAPLGSLSDAGHAIKAWAGKVVHGHRLPETSPLVGAVGTQPPARQ